MSVAWPFIGPRQAYLLLQRFVGYRPAKKDYRMSASRAASTQSKSGHSRPATGTKATAAQKPARKTPGARAVSDSRKAAEMLREIQIEGEALSAQIDRLRHRFL
jgi:hypothetical protein